MDRRIVRTKAAVRQATLELLGSRGYAAFSVEGVGQLAGVAKSTIYRHWPTKLGLIADALETLNEQPQPDISATTARGQVAQLIDHLVAAFAASPYARSTKRRNRAWESAQALTPPTSSPRREATTRRSPSWTRRSGASSTPSTA